METTAAGFYMHQLSPIQQLQSIVEKTTGVKYSAYFYSALS